MLSERDVMKCLSAAGCYGNVKMTFESGPYSIDRPTINASKFAEQIESAATAPLLARIAELDRSLDVMAQNTEAQAHASLQREIELTEKGEKLTRELAEARMQMEAQKDEWFSWEAKRRDLEKDAEMYRWLRDYHIGDDPESINLKKAKTKGLDAAIRAAIKEQT